MSINNAARLKVAGGVAKGRRLESPDVFLRPMMAKVCAFVRVFQEGTGDRKYQAHLVDLRGAWRRVFSNNPFERAGRVSTPSQVCTVRFSLR